MYALYDLYSSYYTDEQSYRNGDMERKNKPLDNINDLQSIQVDDESKFHHFSHFF